MVFGGYWPQKPEIEANIASSSTKVRTLPVLSHRIRLFFPPPFPQGQNALFFLETWGLDEAEDSPLELLPEQSYEVAASRRA